METRANHVWVGAVTLALIALVAAFVLWITRVGEGDQQPYDIFFKQSVDGLAKGAQVTFAGVPAGQIDKIELWPRDPSFVRVRIKVDKKIPVLQGTTATIQGSFTGVSSLLTSATGLDNGSQTRNGNTLVTTYRGTVAASVVGKFIPIAPGASSFAVTFSLTDDNHLVAATIHGAFFAHASDIRYSLAMSACAGCPPVTPPTS